MKNILIILFSLVFFASCGNVKDINIEELQYINIKSLKGSNAVVEIGVLVNNPSTHNLIIKAANIEILRDGYYFGTADLHEKVTIPKRTYETATITFNVKITDKMAILSGRIRNILAGEDRTKLSFNGYIKGGTKMVSKKIKLENVEF